MKKYIIGIGIGIIIAAISYHFIKVGKLKKEIAACQYVIEQIEINPITARDTIYDTISIKTPVLVPITHTDSIFDTISQIVNYKKFYQGTDTTTDGILYYKLQTKGDLLWHQYKYRYTKPVITNEKIVFVDKPVYLKQKFRMHAFIETGITQHQISSGLMLSYQSLGVMYRYDITNNSHNAGITLKLK